jgi:hypothetical protein
LFFSSQLEAFRFPFAFGPKANGGKVKSERTVRFSYQKRTGRNGPAFGL